MQNQQYEKKRWPNVYEGLDDNSGSMSVVEDFSQDGQCG